LKKNAKHYPSNPGGNILKRTFSLSIVCLTLFLLSSCASSPPPEPDYRFAKDAIKIRIKSDPQLNMKDKKPHTLLVCVYQIRDKSIFEQFSASEDGIYQLLDCEAFNDTVTATKRLIIQPNQDMTLVMDRMDKTKTLGIAAGYFKLDKMKMTKLFDIPVSTVGSSEARVEPMNLYINLGAQQIVGAEVH
jgi:type VI secretion system VasD/TssJ family lipoprotein